MSEFEEYVNELDQSVDDGVVENDVCTKCGAEITDDQLFCPKCGQKVGGNVEADKGKPAKKNIIIILAVCIALLAIGTIFFVIRGVQAKEVVLNKKEVTIKVGETAELSYTINPDNTKVKDVTWFSSNDTISTVNDGIIEGKNEGTNIISVTTTNNKTDTCAITVIAAGPDLVSIYNDYCEDGWAELSADNSYISIDTNPYDIKDEFDIDAMQAIEDVLKALGFSDAVLKNMYSTSSADGKQTEEIDNVRVSWKYHPDKGMETIFSITD